MKKQFFITAIICLFSLFSLSKLNGQSDNQFIEDRIQELEEQLQFKDSLLVNPNISIEDYYNSNYLKVGEILSLQTETLLSITPDIPLDSISENALFQTILLESNITQKLDELNMVSDKAKFKGKKLFNPFGFLSDAELKSHHHSLLEYIELHQNISETEGLKTLNGFVKQKLSFAEHELKRRNLYPSEIGNNNVKLLSEKYLLEKEFNRKAIIEAHSLADGSALTFRYREDLNRISERINQINEEFNVLKVDKLRNHLTIETIQRRIEILENGFKDIEKKHHIKRHFDTETKAHLSIINENLIAEKKHLYIIKKHEAINNSIVTRGPPQQPFSDLYSDKIGPDLSPRGDGNGLALGDYLTEKDCKDIKNKTIAERGKDVKKQYEKFKALLPSKSYSDFEDISKRPQGKNIFFLKKPITSQDILRHHALRFYELIGNDLQKGVLAAEEFKIASKQLGFSTKDMVPHEFINSNEKSRFTNQLTNVQNFLKNHKTRLGTYAPSWVETTQKIINNEIENLKSPTVKELGGLVNRPPPLSSEVSELAKLKELGKACETVSAIFGVDTAPSISLTKKNIDKIIEINNISNVVSDVQEYKFLNSLIKTIRTLPPDAEFSTEINDLISYEKELSTRVNQILVSANKPEIQNSIPKPILANLKNVEKSLPKPTKTSLNTSKTRLYTNQSVEKLMFMTAAKSPGGIWLTPDYMPTSCNDKFYTDFERDEQLYSWDEIETYEICPLDTQEWEIDETTKICFSTQSESQQDSHWITQLKPWDYD